jgi:drug/metabolite transporter (DMT)-like permease
MFSTPMPSAGILLALLSAIVWGTGDFVGGAAARRSNQFQVLALSALSGVVLLAICALVCETMPSGSSLGWAAVAGLATAVGIASLYQGLALGGAAIVAPVAAVVTAIIPALFAAFTLGPPDAFQRLGFVAALVGIWLVTRAPATAPISRKSLQLALRAGGGFGSFLILISQIEGGLVFAPLAVARTVTLTVALALMWLRTVPFPSPLSNPLALVAGMLDAGGNVFFVLAEQHTRLDVAAVLSSLYPVATVALARIVWHERVTLSQWAGIVVCLISVALMAE